MKIIDQKFSQNVINDIFEWDIANWSQSLNLWEPAIDQYLKNKKNVVALDLGSRHGGTSLYFALKNIKCVCSNSKEIFSKAKKLHQKYGVQDLISYEIINIKNIPYENKFDIICFKSVIGAVGKDKDYKNQKTRH
jgi:SAM-dependent methyltransferase